MTSHLSGSAMPLHAHRSSAREEGRHPPDQRQVRTDSGDRWLSTIAPWIDLLGLIVAAIAWQQLIAWGSWVWLLPGAAAAIALASGFIAASARAARGLPEASTEVPSTDFPLNHWILAAVALACGVGLLQQALWVMPAQMLGPGLMTGLLAVVFLARQIPSPWWPLRFLAMALVIVPLLLITGRQPFSPLVHALYAAALIGVAISVSVRANGIRGGIPQELFGSLVFGLGVGVAPHFMANQGLESWLGRGLLASSLAIFAGRLCLTPFLSGGRIDPYSLLHRWPALRRGLVPLLGLAAIVGGVMLAEPAGRERWFGLALLISALWLMPMASLLPRFTTPTKTPKPLRAAALRAAALRAAALLWVALGPASGPLIVWWFRDSLG